MSSDKSYSLRGFNFGYSAFLNSKFIGSNQGTNQYSANGGTDMTNDTWTFAPADLAAGDNVLTVIVDPTGLEEDYDGDDTFKAWHHLHVTRRS